MKLFGSAILFIALSLIMLARVEGAHRNGLHQRIADRHQAKADFHAARKNGRSERRTMGRMTVTYKTVEKSESWTK